MSVEFFLDIHVRTEMQTNQQHVTNLKSIGFTANST